MLSAPELIQGLANFYGSETYTKISPFIKNLVATDGVIFLAKNAEAFWLLDIVASYLPKLKGEEFQTWTFKKTTDDAGVVIATDGNKKQLVKQEVPFTDFPLPEINMYLQLGSLDGINPMWVLMLTSEY